MRGLQPGHGPDHDVELHICPVREIPALNLPQKRLDLNRPFLEYPTVPQFRPALGAMAPQVGPVVSRPPLRPVALYWFAGVLAEDEGPGLRGQQTGERFSELELLRLLEAMEERRGVYGGDVACERGQRSQRRQVRHRSVRRRVEGRDGSQKVLTKCVARYEVCRKLLRCGSVKLVTKLEKFCLDVVSKLPECLRFERLDLDRDPIRWHFLQENHLLPPVSDRFQLINKTTVSGVAFHLIFRMICIQQQPMSRKIAPLRSLPNFRSCGYAGR